MELSMISERGSSAYNLGLKVTSCPFKQEGPQRDAWRSGWNSAARMEEKMEDLI